MREGSSKIIKALGLATALTSAASIEGALHLKNKADAAKSVKGQIDAQPDAPAVKDYIERMNRQAKKPQRQVSNQVQWGPGPKIDKKVRFTIGQGAPRSETSAPAAQDLPKTTGVPRRTYPTQVHRTDLYRPALGTFDRIVTPHDNQEEKPVNIPESAGKEEKLPIDREAS